MDRRQEQLGRNEALFRQINERLERLGEAFSLVAEAAEFVCECGDAGCIERISLTLEEYERVRSDATQFVVKRGHEARPDGTLHDVVDETERFSIVKKRPGGPAELAAARDPRS